MIVVTLLLLAIALAFGAMAAVGRYHAHHLAELETWYETTLEAAIEQTPTIDPLPNPGAWPGGITAIFVDVRNIRQVFDESESNLRAKLASFTQDSTEYIEKLKAHLAKGERDERPHGKYRALSHALEPDLTYGGEGLRLRAFHFAAENDPDRFVETFETWAGLLRYAASSVRLHEHVRRMEAEKRFYRELHDALPFVKLTGAHLALLQDIVRTVPGLPPASIPILAQGWATYRGGRSSKTPVDLTVEVARMRVERWQDPSAPWPTWFSRMFTQGLTWCYTLMNEDAATYAHILSHTREIAQAAESRGEGVPSNLVRERFDELESSRRAISQSVRAYVAFNNTAYRSLDVEPLFTASGRDDYLLTVLALERYKLAHGAYPETLGEIAPTYLDTIPESIPAQWDYVKLSESYDFHRKGANPTPDPAP